MKKIKEEKGSMAVYVIVTLVSFCLILTGIYISTSSVRKAQIKTDIKIKEVYENSYVSNNSDNIGNLIDNGKVKIGDYVAYTPTGDTSYTVNGTYSGTGSDQVINKEDLNWRVLDKTADGKVRLISATPTAAGMQLRGADGYNNGVYLLDELCNTLYKGENATAQNLKIEDIQDKMDLSVWNYNDYTNYGSTYNPRDKNYPLIFSQEKDQVVDGKIGTLGLSEQNSIITGRSIAGTCKVTYTSWRKAMAPTNYINQIYYELFHENGRYSYWLSSRCVRANSQEIMFEIRRIGDVEINTEISFSDLFIGENENRDILKMRPVVSLDSNVEIDTSVEGKDGKTPETAWVIK